MPVAQSVHQNPHYFVIIICICFVLLYHVMWELYGPYMIWSNAICRVNTLGNDFLTNVLVLYKLKLRSCSIRWDKSRIRNRVTGDFQAHKTANLRPKPIFTGLSGEILFF